MAKKQMKRRRRPSQPKALPYLSDATYRSLRAISVPVEPIITDYEWEDVRQEFPFGETDRAFFDRIIAFYRLNKGSDTPRQGPRAGETRKDLLACAKTVRTFIGRMSRLESNEPQLKALSDTAADSAVSAVRKNVAGIIAALEKLSERMENTVQTLPADKVPRTQKNEILYYLMWLITMWVRHYHDEWIRRGNNPRNQDIVQAIIRVFRIADQSIKKKTIRVAAEKAVPKWAKDPSWWEVRYEKMATIIDRDYTGK